MSERPFDEVDPEAVAKAAALLEEEERAELDERDGEGFDPALVPDGPLGELFRDGRTGRGLSDAEWDEQAARWREAGVSPFDTE